MKTVNRLSVEHKGRWLALCMFVCLLLLSACQTAEVPPVPAQPAVEDPEKQEEATLINPAFADEWEKAPPGTLALLLNQIPDGQEMQIEATNSLILSVGSDGASAESAEAGKAGEMIDQGSDCDLRERFFILPGSDVVRIAIYSVEFGDSGLVRQQTVYEAGNIDPVDYVLEIWAQRPEGIPQFEIEIESSAETVVYPIAYNGKDGHPPIEYIKSSM
ncbi:MAG TPA: hypothetical protein GX726_02200 [Clostridiales bacterium]|nr:hypothetical protein [Clostridiales bacterium]